MKGRVVPHGNRDKHKHHIRKDSSTATLSVIRLLFSIVTFLGFRLACADIKGAYLQSGPILRDIFVRPPQEWKHHKSCKRGTLWKLTKLPYGIIEAGRKWQKTVEEWMLTQYGLERVFGLSQLYIKRDSTGRIALIIAKVTGDFIIRGRKACIEHFIKHLKRRFVVGKVVMDSKFIFNGCEIEQDTEGNIKMSMYRYLDRIKHITLSRSRRKMVDDHVTDKELRHYRALAGTLLYVANGVLPQASYVVSLMQQRTSALKVIHLIDANEMLNELIALKPWILFRKPRGITRISYCTFSDALHPNTRDYGQTGIVSVFTIETENSQRPIFQPIDWTSKKQERVSYSAYGAEILAGAAADDKGFYYKTALQSLFPNIQINHELTIDSRCLFDTITTQHESTEYRLRPTVQRMRNSFESRELDVLRWIPGVTNVADALTKRNLKVYENHNQTCSEGYLYVELDMGYEHHSSSWQ